VVRLGARLICLMVFRDRPHQRVSFFMLLVMPITQLILMHTSYLGDFFHFDLNACAIERRERNLNKDRQRAVRIEMTGLITHYLSVGCLTGSGTTIHVE